MEEKNRGVEVTAIRLMPKSQPVTLRFGFDHRGGGLNDNVEIEAFLLLVVAQIGGSGLPAEIGLIALREMEGDLNPAADGCQRRFAFLQFHPVRTSVVSDRAELGLRTRCLAALVDSLLHGFESFGGFHAGRDDQLSRHLWVDAAKAIVGGMVQRDTVAVVALPSIPAHGVETLCGLLQSFEQEVLAC